jgi:hypothetical protein
MGKVLNSTVHFVDPDTGETEIWHPGRKLSAADIKKLGWPKGHESIGEDDEEDSPEGDPEDEQAKLRQAARELETQAQQEGSARQSFPADEVQAQAEKSAAKGKSS